MDISSVAKAKLASWIVEQNRLGAAQILVSADLLQSTIGRPRLSVIERVYRLYRFLGHRLVSIGRSTPWYVLPYEGDASLAQIEEIRLSARAWTESTSDEELDALAKYCFTQKTLQKGEFSGEISLSVEGWQTLEQLDKSGASSDQAFVAMWFGPEVASAYEHGIAPAVRDAMSR